MDLNDYIVAVYTLLQQEISLRLAIIKRYWKEKEKHALCYYGYEVILSALMA